MSVGAFLEGHWTLSGPCHKNLRLTILFILFLHLESGIRDEITKAILILQEDDTLLKLKDKWWKTSNCQSTINQKEDASELGVKNIGGIFLVLISGLVAGVMAAVAEFVWKSRQNANLDRVSRTESH